MKRTNLARGPHRPKPKRHPADVPKRLGQSAVDKAPWRSPAYRAHVRTKPCLGCGMNAAHAHHIRESFPRTIGVRISDKYVIPLCEPCHTELHKNAVTFWMARLGKIGDHHTIDWCEKTHREWAAAPST
jgi:hypothetical protein